MSTRAFYEQLFRREGLEVWDDRWHRLSAPARQVFLEQTPQPYPDPYTSKLRSSSVWSSHFPPEVLAELEAAGFVHVERTKTPDKQSRVSIAEGALDFTLRLKTLRMYAPLDRPEPRHVEELLRRVCAPQGFHDYLKSVLKREKVDIELPNHPYGTPFSIYVGSRRWPDWVTAGQKGPAGRAILDAIVKAGGRVRVTDLTKLVPDIEPGARRSAYEDLVGRAALFEQVAKDSLEIEVGFLPVVLGLRRSAREGVTEVEPVVCEVPREVGPEAWLVDDLRALLLEVASNPPRLKKDGQLYARDVGRFVEALTPVPDWLARFVTQKPQERLDRAVLRSVLLGLATDGGEEGERLTLTPQGEEWLVAGLGDQYAAVYRYYRELEKHVNPYRTPEVAVRLRVIDTFGYGYDDVLDDSHFLGSDVVAVPRKKGKRSRSPYERIQPTDEEARAVRDAVGRALLRLEPDRYYRMDTVIASLSDGGRNVLLGGRTLDDIVVAASGQTLPPLDDVYEAAASVLANGLIVFRLIPVGAMRAAVAPDGTVCVARTSRLGAYFGLEPMPKDEAAAPAETKVVVQPDFTVVVFGLNPAPVAEIAPFAERVTRGASVGAQTLRISRESVVQAAGRGLTPEEMIARLRRLSSHDLPGNVVHEIREWGGVVRRVTAEKIAVIRCPDRATADRVVATYKNKVERLGDTVVGLPGGLPSKADREKLRAAGLIVGGEATAKPAAAARTRKKKGRW